ncbi:MAG: Zn-dependent alcohol dehydrogenase [Planctomycetes bacterium]|nr:Zn-dependent alcohol dehydrogenase [Planctomycetota bacterium]
MKVRAAVLFQPGSPFRVTDLDLAEPRAGEVRVRVQAAGICHSDWHVATGDTRQPLPVVCGHEGAGIVEALGPDVPGFRIGDFVSLNWAPACGECFYCAGGRPCLCERTTNAVWAGTLLDGSPRLSLGGAPVFHYCALACFAERCVVPAGACVPLDRSVPPSVAALIGCAVTTGVGAVMNTAQVPPGASVAVFGAGGVGLSIILGAKLAGAASILAIDRVPAKAEAARAFGATDAVAGTPDELVQAVRARTAGRGADFVFEAVGVPAVQELCIEAARPGGQVVFVGLAPMGTATNLPGAVLVRKELTVKGSYYGTCRPARDFARIAAWYREGRLDLERLISRTYRLDEINEAYADMLSGATARGVIVFPEAR